MNSPAGEAVQHAPQGMRTLGVLHYSGAPSPRCDGVAASGEGNGIRQHTRVIHQREAGRGSSLAVPHAGNSDPDSYVVSGLRTY